MNGIVMKDYEPLIDVRRDAEGRIVEGLRLGDILRQNQALILTLHKGELKERPLVGVGLSDMLLDNDPMYWRSSIMEQLEMDGQRVESVEVTTHGVKIASDYEEGRRWWR